MSWQHAASVNKLFHLREARRKLGVAIQALEEAGDFPATDLEFFKARYEELSNRVVTIDVPCIRCRTPYALEFIVKDDNAPWAVLCTACGEGVFS